MKYLIKHTQAPLKCTQWAKWWRQSDDDNIIMVVWYQTLSHNRDRIKELNVPKSDDLLFLYSTHGWTKYLPRLVSAAFRTFSSPDKNWSALRRKESVNNSESKRRHADKFLQEFDLEAPQNHLWWEDRVFDPLNLKTGSRPSPDNFQE